MLYEPGVMKRVRSVIGTVFGVGRIVLYVVCILAAIASVGGGAVWALAVANSHYGKDAVANAIMIALLSFVVGAGLTKFYWYIRWNETRFKFVRRRRREAKLRRAELKREYDRAAAQLSLAAETNGGELSINAQGGELSKTDADVA